MYNIPRNNYYSNEKETVIYTPKEISNFIYKVLKKDVSAGDIVFDPCVGQGSLIIPWQNAGYETKYFDIKYQGFEGTKIQNYLKLKKENIDFIPKLVVINPPFNSDEDLRQDTCRMGFGTRPFIPEVFLSKTIELFGRSVIIVLFTPYGFRLNVAKNSKRLERFHDGIYPDISSIISLPKNIYDSVNFHSEILIFNSKRTKPHYFVDLDSQGD
jgi:type I restriction enzyme M protein